MALKANVAIGGANGRRKQRSLNRAYQTRNKATTREPVTAYHCASETVDRTENNQGGKWKRKTKRRQAYTGHTKAACERHKGVCSSPKTRWKEHGIEEKLRNEISRTKQGGPEMHHSTLSCGRAVRVRQVQRAVLVRSRTQRKHRSMKVERENRRPQEIRNTMV